MHLGSGRTCVCARGCVCACVSTLSVERVSKPARLAVCFGDGVSVAGRGGKVGVVGGGWGGSHPGEEERDASHVGCSWEQPRGGGIGQEEESKALALLASRRHHLVPDPHRGLTETLGMCSPVHRNPSNNRVPNRSAMRHAQHPKYCRSHEL